MAISWTQKQRDIYALLEKGMPFSQVVEQGFAKATVSAVNKAFKAGEKPPEPKAPPVQTTGNTPLATIKTPATGITTFTVGQEQIPIFPEDLRQCFDEFRDMQHTLGWESDFSSTIREGVKLLRTVVGSFVPEEVTNDTGASR